MSTIKYLDLTEGPIVSKLARLAMPILGSSFLQMLYNLTDIFWLGRLNAASVAGAGIGGFILWMLSSLGLLSRSASIIMSSKARGEKNDQDLHRVANLGLFWTLVLGLASSVVLLLAAGAIVGLFGLDDPAASAEGIRYIRVIGLGSPFLLLFPALSAMSIGWGNSRIPFQVSLLSVGLNIVLDPLLIFGFGMGASGAAWATVIANAMGSLVLLLRFRGSFAQVHRFRDYLGMSGRFLRLGLPQCLESSVYSGFSMLVGTLLGRFGPVVLAANSLGAQVESLTWMIAVGIASASTSFTGQNLGAMKQGRIVQGYYSVLWLTLSYSLGIGLVFLFAPRLVAGLFTNQPDILELCVEYFIILAFSQPMMALEIAIAGTFRGIQRPNFPAFVSILITMARLPLSWFLIAGGFSYQAVWWVISGTSIAKGLVISLAFMPVFRSVFGKTARIATP